MNLGGGQVEVLVQHHVGLHHQIVLRTSGHFLSMQMQGILLPRRGLQGSDFQRIFQRDGIKDGFQVMVSVRTLADDVQPQVYFRIRECQHTLFSVYI